MSGKLSRLVSSRGNYRGQVNRIYDDLSSLPNKTKQDRDILSAKLKRLQKELNNLDPDIRDLKWEINQTDEAKAISENNLEISESTLYEDKIDECLIALSNSVLLTPDPSLPSDPLKTRLKSATVPLPKFSSADGEDLTKFLQQFEETTKRFNYSDYDKFLLLKQQISGRAASLIHSLDIHQYSYQAAKSLLEDALASTATRKYNIIKQMSDLKLDYDTEPFEYIGKINSLHDAFATLNISTDEVLQYFAWTGLNEHFKSQLVQITNESKPSLQQIRNKFFEANERYLNIQRRYKNKKVGKETTSRTTHSFATGLSFAKNEIQNVFKTCPLCSKQDSSHPIHKCIKYPDSKTKVERLKILNACIKCGRLDHKDDSCKFRFHNRCDCGSWHFKFLCLGEKNSKKTEIEKSKSKGVKQQETNSGSSCIDTFSETFQVTNCSLAVLPTFSCILQSGEKIRCMRDSGCQSNFITEDRARRENLPVIESDIKLKVNGFNSSQIYHTRSYKVHLRIGSEVFEVHAMGVPSIRTHMKLPGLNTVVQEFSTKGYVLADEFLLDGQDEIGNIEFILGSNYAFCLKESLVLFGDTDNDPPSVYSSTPSGVMLVGNIEQMKVNMSFLPKFANTSVEAHEILVESPAQEGPTVICKDLGLHSNLCIESSTENDVPVEVEVNFVVLKDNGEIAEIELQKATKAMLEKCCSNTLNYDKEEYSEDTVEINNKIISYVLNNTARNEEGRLVMPLIWNNKVDHHLGKNRNLAVSVLKSNFKKLSKNGGEYLKMVDKAFKEQREMGIIDMIEDLDTFLEENPSHSFLAHMGVFKPERDTTKCRVVFLSNVCGKNPSQAITLSHNQTMLSGPCLNQKLSTALLHLRFDSKLLCFDIKKAFLNIGLTSLDSNKLLFLWYRNVEKGDFSIVGYRNLRLPFGLVCSPCLLLLGLYKILMLDVEADSQRMKNLKRHIYSLIYMDNGSLTANEPGELRWAYDNLRDIFEPYQFFLQQFVTNDEQIQAEIDKNSTDSTPEEVKLFGLSWNRINDTLSTKPFHMDNKANTKRLILKSIAEHFDLFGFTGPILNRARLFLHNLQCDKSLNWDSKLSSDLLREWNNICKQTNSSPNVKIKRFVGPRDGSYRLLAFTDSSKDIYGTVIFLQNVDSLQVSFVLAKNRIVNKQLSSKSIPSLEFQAITLGTEVLMDTYQELCGSSCVNPIKITDLQLFSDSMVSLAWINLYANKLDKMNKHSVFIRNRLEFISKLCETHPVTYQFISGIENPADLITRPTSYKVLMKSNYYSGPNFLEKTPNLYSSRDDLLSVTVPNPIAKSNEIIPENAEDVCEAVLSVASEEEPEHLVLMDRCSDFFKLVSVHSHVLQFVRALKTRLYHKDPVKYGHMGGSNEYLRIQAKVDIIRTEQRIHFPEIFQYFNSDRKNVKDIPNLVNQLNIYLDKQGLLRVKSKFSRWKDDESIRFPILLPKYSSLTRMIILDLHHTLSHAGCYRLLSELRKQFWVPHYFSIVKQILKSCITCRKIKQRTIKLNQSPYREFRLDPPNVPFRSIFIDHLGHYFVKHNGSKIKVWILCITCLWTRAINLKVCLDLSTKEFLRALQLHSFEYGVPQLCLSDLGSSFVAGANIVTDFLKDVDTQKYFEEQGVRSLTFEQYFKGYHPLGGLVEICVKMVKQLLQCSIKNYVLDYRDFEFITSQTVHLVNRRPIAFQEGLRDTSNETIPDPITPERLIHGFDLTSVNLIPGLQGDPEYDPEWLVSSDPINKVKETYEKLKKVRTLLTETYHSEFLGNLMKQAVNDKNRYKPVTHTKLQLGDIVLIKEENCKPINYPMAVVKEIKININDEVTDAVLLKGKNREVVKRHVTSLIPILTCKEMSPTNNQIVQSDLHSGSNEASHDHPDCPLNTNRKKGRLKRKAALKSIEKTRKILSVP